MRSCEKSQGRVGLVLARASKNWKLAAAGRPSRSKSDYVTLSHPPHPSIFRLREQLQNQNNKSQKSDSGGGGGDQIKNLEAQLAEKMKQIKAKKEQMKKKGAYG